MKKNLTVLILVLILSKQLEAQFGINPITGATRGETIGLIEGVSIGNYPSGVFSSARFHINNFYTPTPGGALNGLLLRADGANNVDNSWTLFTGPTVLTTTEKFKLFVPANTNNTVLQTTQAGLLYYNTNALRRMSVGHLAFAASLVGTGGFPNPLPGNRLTRTTINRDGTLPILRPLSLLHLGYDFPLLPQGGQRYWMDVETICMAGTDQLYVGLRQQSSESDI